MNNCITNIKIENIRGFGSASKSGDLVVGIESNKPNFVVAPNGFGKTSISVAFDVLLPCSFSKLSRENRFNNSENSPPRLVVTMGNETYESVGSEKYEVQTQFITHVVKNRIKIVSKSNRHHVSVAHNKIEPIVLMKNYPSYQDSNYNDCKEIRDNLDNLLSACNSTRHNDLKTKKNKTDLIFEFPYIDTLSNGQRDILSLICQLYIPVFNFESKDKPVILIIDEVFDYLDDANIIVFQHSLQKVIDIFKNKGKIIFPIILTHLSPDYFKTFRFNKYTASYLPICEYNNKYNINGLLKDRNNSKKTNENIYNDISSRYLHYSNKTDDDDATIDYIGRKLDSNIKWTVCKFNEVCNDQLYKYFNNDEYSPAWVCIAIRRKVEEILYEKMEEQGKDEFLNKNGTEKKIKYAIECGIEVPETMSLLGIIYNECMHLDPELNQMQRLIPKLHNRIIKSMIKDTVDV